MAKSFWDYLETGDCPNSGICICMISKKRPEKKCVNLSKQKKRK